MSYYLGAKEPAAKPPLIAPVPMFATVPPVPISTKKLVIYGSIAVVALAAFVYWRSTRKGATSVR